MLNILLVDDEPTIRLTVGDALERDGHRVTVLADGGEALAVVADRIFDLVISDIRLPKADGLSIFRSVKKQSPETDVILMTAFAEVKDAVSALKEGANDYLTKPFDVDEIRLRVERIAEVRRVRAELAEARLRLSERRGEHSITGNSPAIMSLKKNIETMAESDAPVLITGESGTGKELVAETLHAMSGRHERPFVAVNCAAFPETLLEAELFGHERGAFTGAMKAREGRFQAAHRGTLLLDEIAEIPLPAQAKLLRVLQEGRVEPLGTNQSVHVDVRLLSATHRNLKERIQQGLFREDLYYRLKVLDLNIPPLRERRGDLPLLVEHFLAKHRKNEQELAVVSPAAWAALLEYPFPGNVRELEHAIERALVLSRGRAIELEHLPEDIRGQMSAMASDEAGETVRLRPLAVASKEFEKEYLIRALRLTEGRKAEAAEKLGISRKNLWEKLKQHNVDWSARN